MEWLQYASTAATLVVAVATLWQAKSSARSATAALAAADNQALIGAQQIQAASKATTAQTLATVVTSARLQWIDALRDDVAAFLAITERWSIAEAVGVAHDSQEAFREAFERRLMLRNRIELRLDPAKQEHSELIKSLDATLGADEWSQGSIGAARDLTKALIEKEWGRAKSEAAGVVPLSHPTQKTPLT